MLLRLIRESNFFGIFLIPVAGILFWMHSFQSPADALIPAKEATMPLFNIVQSLFNKLIFWQILTGFILVILNALVITRICSSFLLYKKGTALPGILFVITISSVRELQTFHPVHLATLCILVAISYIFDTYQKRVEIPHTFNASFFIALASLFYFPAAIIFPLIWISIFVLQKSDNWRLLVVPVFGFCVPWFFYWAVAFLKGSEDQFWLVIKNVTGYNNLGYLSEPVFLIKSGVIMLLILFGSISFLAEYQSVKISARKYLTIFYWMFGMVIISGLLLVTVGKEFAAINGIPSAIIMSYFFLSGRKYFWKEVFLLVYIGVMAGTFILYRQ